MAQLQTRNNPVEHPNHYSWIPEIECLDVVEYFNFNLGCVIKYVWRAPTKTRKEKIEDLRKAAFYLEREIARLQHHEVAIADMTYFESLNRKKAESLKESLKE